MNAFSVEVDGAYSAAVIDAAPFVPSRAQIEAALLPVVQRLVAMPGAHDYIRASFRGAGSLDSIAISMLKEIATPVCSTCNRVGHSWTNCPGL